VDATQGGEKATGEDARGQQQQQQVAEVARTIMQADLVFIVWVEDAKELALIPRKLAMGAVFIFVIPFRNASGLYRIRILGSASGLEDVMVRLLLIICFPFFSFLIIVCHPHRSLP
jgi:hypothetical protein